jgi:hypothetical protein
VWPVAAPAQGNHLRQLACTGSAKSIAPAFGGVGDWCIVQERVTDEMSRGT